MAKFKWTVEIEVDETWVADGFDLTDERMADIMLRHLSFAYSHEIGARVIARPADTDVASAQGYQSVGEYLHARTKDAP